MKNNAAVFVHSTTDRIYKILPLMESEPNQKNERIEKYIESIILSMKGAVRVFDELDGDREYMSVLCSVSGLLDDGITFGVAKRTIFRCLKLLNAIEDRLGGDAN